MRKIKLSTFLREEITKKFSNINREDLYSKFCKENQKEIVNIYKEKVVGKLLLQDPTEISSEKFYLWFIDVLIEEGNVCYYLCLKKNRILYRFLGQESLNLINWSENTFIFINDD